MIGYRGDLNFFEGEPKGTFPIFSALATLTFQRTDFRDSALKLIPVRTRIAKVLIGKNRFGPSPLS
ncbi:MAG: hypothetical protein AAB014_07280 [Nitrospirota bacterium]